MIDLRLPQQFNGFVSKSVGAALANIGGEPSYAAVIAKINDVDNNENTIQIDPHGYFEITLEGWGNIELIEIAGVVLLPAKDTSNIQRGEFLWNPYSNLLKGRV